MSMQPQSLRLQDGDRQVADIQIDWTLVRIKVGGLWGITIRVASGGVFKGSGCRSDYLIPYYLYCNK